MYIKSTNTVSWQWTFAKDCKSVRRQRIFKYLTLSNKMRYRNDAVTLYLSQFLLSQYTLSLLCLHSNRAKFVGCACIQPYSSFPRKILVLLSLEVRVMKNDFCCFIASFLGGCVQVLVNEKTRNIASIFLV